MNRLSAQAQLYIAIALIVVMSLAVIFLAILPQFQKAADVQDQIGAEQSDLSAAQALLARRQSAKAQSASNEVALMRIANQVPDSPQLPSVIIELQDVANAAGVDFQSIAPGEPVVPQAEDGAEPVTGYMAVPLTLLVRGDWAELIDYFRRIDDLDRGVRVTDIAFVYVPATEGTDTTTPAYVEANLTLEVYVMVAAVSPDDPAGSTTTTTTTTP